MATLPQKLASTMLLKGLAPRLDSRIGASSEPFDCPEIIAPQINSARWACTHYGVFIPELPEPYRYLNTMTLIGASGALCFDNDYLVSEDARRTATVLSSTAHGPEHHYRAYDTSADCQLAEDSSLLQWGDDLTIRCEHPRYALSARYGHMAVELQVTATQVVSWFVRSPVCDHFSLLATYTGSIEDANGHTDISGLCTFEYARYMSPQSLTAKPLPEALKLPVDFFTYQIINLNERTQLLLTDVRAAGVSACRLAHLRSLDGDARVFDDVTMEVLGYQSELAIDPRGRQMRVPAKLRWTVRENGDDLLHFDADVDSPLRYGHGRGYVGAYTYSGVWNGEPVTGTGYLEWVDCE
ncbi:hypothetical protein FHU29_001293 [Hoyosella altamirensis]|uniref:AttH domain-containing protein n=2 Tax=Hoyosella altamirensis TaxID=616997 RepID=A0A839RKM9_9ACTN|nr:hypothetical protein [Hoyosella altamirensis]